MIAEGKRKLLYVLLLVMFIGIAIVQNAIDPQYLKMAARAKPKSGGDSSEELMVKLPGQFIVASIAGFKEVIAGALWIRADSFFHSGDYQAIIPIVRLVTWLDPHNLDVYTTGAWHLDYNFVDNKTQMSDKRYIPASIAFLKEGIRNNPDVWDLYFELGWTHYNKKLMDYNKSLEYIEKACKHDGLDPNTGERIPRYEFVDRMLAHAYEKVGRFDDSIKQWKKARQRIIDTSPVNKKTGKKNIDGSSLDVCDRNLMMLYLRLGWRYGDMKAYGKGVEMARRLVNRPSPPVLPWAAEGAERDYKQRLAANNPPKDALKPLDVNLQVAVRKVAPKVLLVKGRVNLVPASEYKDLASECFTHWYQLNSKAGADRMNQWRDGCRVFWRLEDADNNSLKEIKTFNWKIDTSKTLVWDSFYVMGGSFGEKIDLSDPRDVEMYPFTAKRYKLTLWISPQDPGCPDYVQDRVGWRGEAFRTKQGLDTKSVPGFRQIKWETYLNRKDIL